jgi:hypothetical protein
MTSLGSIRWIVLALLGLAVAAGVSVAASQLVSQRIGLAAEPPSAGRELAPPQHESASGSRAGNGDATHPTATSTSTTTVPGTTTTVTPTTPPSSTPSSTTAAPPSTSSQGGSEREPPDD